MIRRITLQNYMSHSNTVIEPAGGLTVLVGPNNCGKSAVVSALETLCNNAPGAFMVRHEEKEARVTVETDDGHTFVWKRRGNAVSYIIDGRDIHRVGRGVPEDLHKLLRLPKVDAGENGEPFDIHFGTQKSPIFLLNEPESRAALFFASSSDAAILLEMQKRHRNKVKERKSDHKRLKAEVEKLDAELATLEPLKTLAESMTQAEDQHQELEELQDQIELLKKEGESLYSHSMKHDRQAREYELLAPLKPTPHLADIASINLLIVALLDAERDLRWETARSCALETLASPPELADVSSLASTLRSLAPAEQGVIRWSGCWKCVEDLQTPPALYDAEKLESIRLLIRALVETERELEKERACSLALESVAPPPDLEDVTALSDTVRSLAGAEQNFSRWSGHSTAAKALRTPPALEDAERLQSLCRALSDEEENHDLLKAKAVCLGLLKDVPFIAETSQLKSTVLALDSAQLANGALSRQQRVFGNLVPPPELADPKPLADLVSCLAGTLQDVDRHEGLIKTTAAEMDKLEADVRAAERAGTGALLAGPVERRRLRHILMAIGVCAGIAAVILLFILGPAWFNRLKIESPEEAHKPVDPTATAIAKLPFGKETGKEEPKKEAPKPEKK